MCVASTHTLLNPRSCYPLVLTAKTKFLTFTHYLLHTISITLFTLSILLWRPPPDRYSSIGPSKWLLHVTTVYTKPLSKDLKSATVKQVCFNRQQKLTEANPHHKVTHRACVFTTHLVHRCTSHFVPFLLDLAPC